MHGGIDLKSELGQGTTAIFWIPFNKSQSTKLGSPLRDTKPVSEAFRSDTSMNGRYSTTQIVVGDSLQNAVPPGHLSSRTGTGLEATNSEERLSEDSVQREVDRKSIHVLVVEDKYVEIPSCVYSLVCMHSFLTCPLQCYQPADRSQNDQETRIPRECSVEWQRSSRLSIRSSQHDSPKTRYYSHGLPDACPRRLSSDPSHPSS